MRQPPRAGEGSDRFLRFLAVREGPRRFVPGYDGVRLRPERLQGTGQARSGSEPPTRALQYRVRQQGRLRDGQGAMRKTSPNAEGEQGLPRVSQPPAGTK